MVKSYILLGIAALLPVIAIDIFYFLAKKTKILKLNYWVLQIIVGVIFGGIAIVGTHWGIPMNGAMVNCRDGAVLVAGLFFGGPAGIIAGAIGGIERFLVAYAGIGTYTQIACSVSTFVAGLYAALVRKFIFHGRRPSWLLAFATGVVMETFHLTMVFLTNMADTETAMAVVKACTVPMILFNGLSVMVATITLNAIFKDDLKGSGEKVRLEQTVQRWLMGPIIIVFILTSLFVYRIQLNVAIVQRDNLLKLATQEISDEIDDISNNDILERAYKVKTEIEGGETDLGELSLNHRIAEINIIDNAGWIIDSNITEYVEKNYNMRKENGGGEQSQEFMTEIVDNGAEEFVQAFGPISENANTYRKYAGVKYGDGLIQVGFGEQEFRASIEEGMKDITKNRKVGETGFIIVVSGTTYEIVSAPKDIPRDDEVLEKLGKMDLNPNGDYFELPVNGENCFCRFDPVEGYIVVAFYPEAEAMKAFYVTLYVNTFMEILVFAILFFLINNLVRVLVIKNLDKINVSLDKIAKGNLDEVANVRTNQEFAELSDDINTTVNALKNYIKEAAERIDKELEFAKNIQSSALPSVFPAFPQRKDMDIYACMFTAKEVGGDFYDFYFTHKHTLNILIADVSGKGIPAAMFMMRAKTELKSLTETDLTLDEVFTRGNMGLCEGNDAGMFVTAWQAQLNLKDGKFTYVNAGHNPPLIKKANGKFEYNRGRAGFVLAGMDGVKYRTQELTLDKGDIIFLYTDGVTEATDANSELYGEDRLLNIVNSKEFTSMDELCKTVKADVDKFVGEAPQFDDITMLAFKYIGENKVEPVVKEFDADIGELQNVIDFLEGELEKADCPMKTLMQLDVAVEEIFVNIAHYAYGGKKGKAKVSILTENGKTTISFIDGGKPFNPLLKDDPDTTLTAEERNIGGLGIYMVKKTMDDVIYKYENDQNILTLIKTL